MVLDIGVCLYCGVFVSSTMWHYMWYWTLSVLRRVCVFNNVALCGTRYPAGINIGSRVETVTDTGRGRSATKSEDEEEDGQVVKFQIFEQKEIILLSPFCKSVRPVCAPISHFPK